jgi:hypothetical protein
MVSPTPRHHGARHRRGFDGCRSLEPVGARTPCDLIVMIVAWRLALWISRNATLPGSSSTARIRAMGPGRGQVAPRC